jgi:Ubiquitin family
MIEKKKQDQDKERFGFASSKQAELPLGAMVSPMVSQRLEVQEAMDRKKVASELMELGETEAANSFCVTNRMRRGGPEFEIGQDSFLEIKIQCNDGKPRSFIFQDFQRSTIGELKAEFFEKEIQENKTFRVIYQGRLLKDHDPVANLKVESCKVLHVFMTDKVTPGVRSIPTEAVLETKTGPRGFDFFRDFALSEEDIIWKRFRFHNEYILVESLELIDDDFLVNREEFFLSENKELKDDHQQFRKFNFLDQNKESVRFFHEDPKWKPILFIWGQKAAMFLMGFVFFFFAFACIALSSRMSQVGTVRYEWIFFGACLKLLLGLGLFLVSGQFYFLVPPFL